MNKLIAYTYENSANDKSNVISFLNQVNLKKPTVIFIMGLPASGKSYLANDLKRRYKLPILSQDQYIRRYAEKHKLSFSEAFDKYKDKAFNLLKIKIDSAAKKGKSFIIEGTLLSNKRRQLFLRMVRDHYKIGIYFNPSLENAVKDSKKRYENNPEQYFHNEEWIKDMYAKKEEPLTREFDKLFTIRK